MIDVWLLIHEVSITHSDAPQSVGLLWTSGQLVAETSNWQHKTVTTDRHPWPRRDSNPQSRQASGLRPRGHWDRRYDLGDSNLHGTFKFRVHAFSSVKPWCLWHKTCNINPMKMLPFCNISLGIGGKPKCNNVGNVRITYHCCAFL